MTSTATSPDAYFATLPPDRQEAMQRLRETLKQHLPDGFEETMTYGMVSYVVPLSRYPAGYHCQPGCPLCFISIASQKNFVSLYHMGIYADPKLLDWFTKEYPRYSKTKLDMGKSCIRFKKPEQIPFDLIAELARKMTPQDWITRYENVLNR